MAWYRAGTISLTNGSATVTGAGTAWVSAISIGDALIAPDGRAYEVAGVVSNTQLTLSTPYLGGTASGQTYAVLPTQSFVADLATQATQLLNTFAAVRDGVGNGLFPDGTAALPAIRFAQDQDTGLARIGENVLGIATGGVLRAYVGPDICVLPRSIQTGLGASAEDVAFEIGGLRSGNGAVYLDLHAQAGTDYEARLVRAAGPNGKLELVNQGSGTLYLTQTSAAPIEFQIAGSSVLKFDTTGRALFGLSNAVGNYNGSAVNQGIVLEGPGGGFTAQRQTGPNLSLSKAAGYTDGSFLAFCVTGSAVGTITSNGTATSYNTASDYRLKEDFQPIADPIARLLQINVVNFAWRANGERTEGFLAHELAEIVPDAVTGAKDATRENENGDTVPAYQGVDQSKLVPLLVAAVQALTVRIEALEAA